MNKTIGDYDDGRPHADWCLCEACHDERDAIRREQEDESEDTGRYQGGYRFYRDGSYREDFGSDR